MNSNRQLIEQYFDRVWSAGDLEAQEQLIAADYTGYWLIAGMPVRRGRSSHQAWLANIRAGFPDARYIIHDLVVDGERAVARVTLTGTHSGPMAGRPPTGVHAAADQIFMFHIANGQICEEWVSFDRDSFMKQLEPQAAVA